MPSPHEKLALSLAQLKKLQDKGRQVFRSDELTRVHRERLVKNGFLKEVMKGWLMSWTPDTAPGDTSPWYASFWEFCVQYCNERFGKDWHLSPEQSLLLQAEKNTIPEQVVIYSPKATNNSLKLPFDTSLYDFRTKNSLSDNNIVERKGLRIFKPEAALLKVSEVFYATHPVEARIILTGMQDSSSLLTRLLEGGRSTIAGRLAGAFRSLGFADTADNIKDSLKAADYDIRESDPFKQSSQASIIITTKAPISNRLGIIWEQIREDVLNVFPKAPGLPLSPQQYMETIDEVYRTDAYHSLSIEGYRVTPELIERMRLGDWNPESSDEDRHNRDALAARGYWQTYQLVRKSVLQIIEGENAARLVQSDFRSWYRELFQPMVSAGLIPASVMAGFRNAPVFIKGSRHLPPRYEIVADAIATLFELLDNEAEASVRAVIGHWLIGYIHPYMDGNGRMARFVMNTMLASGGYPWTIIPVKEREKYMQTLECASVDQNVIPFARFISDCMANPVRE